MGIPQVTGAAAPAVTPHAEGSQSFGKILQQAQQLSEGAKPGGQAQTPEVHHARAGQSRAAGSSSRADAAGAVERTAAKAVDQVVQAQHRLDRVLALAQSGKTFSPAELLGLQAQVYSASQQLDLAGKVVEKATSGVKQILQTQI